MKLIKSIFKAIFSETDEMVHIPILSSKGSFTSIDDLLSRAQVGYAHIEGFIFEEYGVSEANAIGIDCDDDSMSPDIKVGWSLLVDLSDVEIQNGEVYAVLLRNQIMFRKVSILNANEFSLKPTNQKFADLVLPMEDVTIIGRAKYILGAGK